MKNVLHLSIIALISLAAASCAIMPGTSYDNSLQNYRYCGANQDSLQIVRDCDVSYRTTIVFGFGGALNKDKNAIEELYKKADLQPGEDLVNVTVNSRTLAVLGPLVMVTTHHAKGQVATAKNAIETKPTPVAPAVSTQTVSEDNQVKAAETKVVAAEEKVEEAATGIVKEADYKLIQTGAKNIISFLKRKSETPLSNTYQEVLNYVVANPTGENYWLLEQANMKMQDNQSRLYDVKKAIRDKATPAEILETIANL